MEKRVLFRPDQHVKFTDFTNLEDYIRSSIDHVVADGISDAKGFTGLQVTGSGVAELTVAPGRVFSSGQIFVLETNVVHSLVARLPSTQRRLCTVVAWGLEIEDSIEPRAYVVDANSSPPTFEPREVAMRSVRTAQIDFIFGNESASPSRGAIDSSVIPICDIVLATSGIVSIVMDPTYQLPSVKGLDLDVDALKLWQALVGQQIETLRSDYAKLASLIPANLAETLTAMAGTLRDIINWMHRPVNVIFTAVDRFRNSVESDTDHAGYSARVEDGLTFPAAAPALAAIQLLNPAEPRIRTVNGVSLPAWDEVIRYSNRDWHSHVIPINYPIITLAWRRHHMTRHCHRYGDWLDRDISGPDRDGVWGNMAERFTVTDQGSAFGLAEIARRPEFPYMQCQRDGGEPYTIDWPHFWEWGEIDRWHSDRFARYYHDHYERPYWPAVCTTGSHGGASVCQSWVQGTNGWMLSVRLWFEERGDAGDIQVLVCRTVNGMPDETQIISSGVAALADIDTDDEGVRVALTPVFLEGGERYGLIFITTGAHSHRTRAGCDYSFGSLYYRHSTNRWIDCLLDHEICFELGFARFRSTRVELQMQAVTLSGGIDSLRVVAAQHVPPGCSAVWEVQNAGNWLPLDDGADNALAGSPVTLPVRLVLIGTRDVMPSIDLTQAEIEVGSTAVNFVHYSEALDFGGATTTVRVDLSLSAFFAAHHTVNVHLVLGGVEGGDGSVVTIVDPQDASRVRKQFSFTIASSTGAVVKIMGTTVEGYGFFTVLERWIHSF